MAEFGAVTRAVAAISLDGRDDRALAGAICRAYVDGLDIDGAAISLRTGHPSRETLWATDANAELLEDLQFSFNQGACMEAAAGGSPVWVADLTHSTQTTRWPLFAAAVAERTTVKALFALPLQQGAVDVGVLDLYRSTAGDLSDGARRDAVSAAETAASLLFAVRTHPGGDQGLDRGTGGRVEIHQATGMVMVQLGINAPDALARLRGYAFTEGRLLLDIAHDVVTGQLSFTTRMG